VIVKSIHLHLLEGGEIYPERGFRKKKNEIYSRREKKRGGEGRGSKCREPGIKQSGLGEWEVGFNFVRSYLRRDSRE
jgi:hypothetical protein